MLFSILSAMTLAGAIFSNSTDEKKTVVVESDSSELSGKSISDIHFGAGLNGVLIADEPNQYSYNSTFEYIYTVYQAGEYYVYFSESDNQLIGAFYSAPISNYSDTTMTHVENDYLTINGSSSVFYACSPLSFDPYGYTKNGTKGVAVYSEEDTVPSTCTPISLRVE